MLYLGKHGTHVNEVTLEGSSFWCMWQPPELRQLPLNLQLHSYHCEGILLQLQPGKGFQGVVRAGVPLKQLRLRECELLDGPEGLAAALSLLPGLEHLCDRLNGGLRPVYAFANADVLLGLQQLTHLELACAQLSGSCQARSSLQPLEGPSQLVHLHLSLSVLWGASGDEDWLAASLLSGTSVLTHLELAGCKLDPRVLSRNAKLQHLNPGGGCSLVDSGTTGMQQLLSRLVDLTQLTHLGLDDNAYVDGAGNPAVAAFSALTVSSKLQHLDISWNGLPAAVWQHIFPPGRQLPHLETLILECINDPATGDPIPAPEGSRLVSCCPSLQCLDIRHLQYGTELLVALRKLSSFQILYLTAENGPDLEGLEVVCQLTGLRQLELDAGSLSEGLLLQLTQLTCLTRLKHTGIVNGVAATVHLDNEVSSRWPGACRDACVLTCNVVRLLDGLCVMMTSIQLAYST
jgi:hypothetical protein